MQRVCALVGVVILLAGCGGSSHRTAGTVGVAKQPAKLTPAEALKRALSQRTTGSAGEDEIVVAQPAKLTPAERRKMFAELRRLTKKYCPSSCTFTAAP
jgi:hypothetical protein